MCASPAPRRGCNSPRTPRSQTSPPLCRAALVAGVVAQALSSSNSSAEQVAMFRKCMTDALRGGVGAPQLVIQLLQGFISTNGCADSNCQTPMSDVRCAPQLRDNPLRRKQVGREYREDPGSVEFLQIERTMSTRSVSCAPFLVNMITQ